MEPIKLNVNGVALIFTDDAVSYAGRKLYYNKMSNISHRNGQQPAFTFIYDGKKRMALPYSQKDKDTIVKVFREVIIPQQKSQSKSRSSYSGSRNGKGALSAGRLTIGIISMVLFIFIMFQSCAAGFVNTVEGNNASSGSAGFLTAVMFLIAGIIGVCTRNTQGKVGPFITAVLYFIGAILTIGSGSTYGDLPIWGGLSAIFGVFFVICGVKSKG